MRWRTSSLLAHPSLAGRGARSSTRGSRVRLLRGPATDSTLDGRAGDLVSLIPFGSGRRRRDDRRPPLPAAARRVRSWDRPAALSNVRVGEHATGDRRGRAGCSSWRPLLRSVDEHARGRRPALRSRPRGPVRRGPSPLRPARPMDDPLLLSRGRHARLHRRGVPVPRRERHDRRARRGRLGHQSRGRRQQARVPREVRPAVHPSGRRRPSRSPRRTARGSRRRTTARSTWGRPHDVPRRPRGRIARVWPKVKPEGHAAEVLAALDEAQAAVAR